MTISSAAYRTPRAHLSLTGVFDRSLSNSQRCPAAEPSPSSAARVALAPGVRITAFRRTRSRTCHPPCRGSSAVACRVLERVVDARRPEVRFPLERPPDIAHARSVVVAAATEQDESEDEVVRLVQRVQDLVLRDGNRVGGAPAFLDIDEPQLSSAGFRLSCRSRACRARGRSARSRGRARSPSRRRAPARHREGVVRPHNARLRFFRSSCRPGPAGRPAGRRAPPAPRRDRASHFSSSIRFRSQRCKVSARRRASPESSAAGWTPGRLSSFPIPWRRASHHSQRSAAAGHTRARTDQRPHVRVLAARIRNVAAGFAAPPPGPEAVRASGPGEVERALVPPDARRREQPALLDLTPRWGSAPAVPPLWAPCASRQVVSDGGAPGGYDVK